MKNAIKKVKSLLLISSKLQGNISSPKCFWRVTSMNWTMAMAPCLSVMCVVQAILCRLRNPELPVWSRIVKSVDPSLFVIKDYKVVLTVVGISPILNKCLDTFSCDIETQVKCILRVRVVAILSGWGDNQCRAVKGLHSVNLPVVTYWSLLLRYAIVCLLSTVCS